MINEADKRLVISLTEAMGLPVEKLSHRKLEITLPSARHIRTILREAGIRTLRHENRSTIVKIIGGQDGGAESEGQGFH